MAASHTMAMAACSPAKLWRLPRRRGYPCTSTRSPSTAATSRSSGVAASSATSSPPAPSHRSPWRSPLAMPAPAATQPTSARATARRAAVGSTPLQRSRAVQSRVRAAYGASLQRWAPLCRHAHEQVRNLLFLRMRQRKCCVAPHASPCCQRSRFSNAAARLQVRATGDRAPRITRAHDRPARLATRGPP